MLAENKKPTLLVIAGPTASGKTDIAIKLAKHFNTEIISADSRQFYKEIPLGTAAPTQSQLDEVKHHFVGNLSIFDDYNVSQYEKDVLKLLDDLFKKHNIVIMAGGSGLYIDAVCKGIDELPDPDPLLRKELNERFENEGIISLQKELETLDPEYFEVVDKKNPKRLMRAIEVCRQTGKKYSELRKNKPAPRNFDIIKTAIDIDRKTLFERIENRTDIMLENGWLEEAEAVYPFRHLNSLNTVGFKELFKYISGEWTLELATEKIKTNTRRYAKRQITWFKKDRDIIWVENGNINNIIKLTEDLLK